MEVTVSEALNIGIDAQKSGRILEAKKIYLDILLNFPSHPDALHNLGILVLNKGDKRKLTTISNDQLLPIQKSDNFG